MRAGFREFFRVRCFSECAQSRWRVFSHVRRWYSVNGVLEAVVYEHSACTCGALWTAAYSVDVVVPS